MPKLIKDIVKKAIKKDTVNLAKALTSQKSLAAQKIAAQKRPMGLKTDSASNMVKALTSPKAKIAQALMAKKKGMGLKVDSTKKVTPIGGSKPSVIIKKETKIKGTKPIDEAFRKKMQAWDKLPKVEYKQFPKKTK